MTRDELRAEWIRRLRSGEYQQCEGTLWDGSGRYCCLGVAMKVAQDEGIWQGSGASEYKEIRHLFGLRGTYGGLGADHGDAISRSLVGLNDRQHKSFPEIADVLESGVAWAD